MYALILKEIRTLYKQLRKTHKLVQILVGVFVLYAVFYLLKHNSIYFSWMRLSNIHYGKEGLAGQPNTLVYYSMKGCPYCKKFDPTWEIFKKKLDSSDCVCKARKVDSKDPECQKNEVQGFPSLLLTDSSKNKIKECPTRDPDAMLAFCKANE